MLESSYNMLFGKLALKCLFEDYFEEANHFRTMIMLKPIDDPNVDLIATVSFMSCVHILIFVTVYLFIARLIVSPVFFFWFGLETWRFFSP